MTLKRALEIANTVDSRDITPASQDFRTAIKLLIEAGKQVIESRFDPSTWEPRLLPGETKE